MVGAVASSTMRARKPSATNSTTLCGWPDGVCAEAADRPATAITAANDKNRYIEWLQWAFEFDHRFASAAAVLPSPRDPNVTLLPLPLAGEGGRAAAG